MFLLAIFTWQINKHKYHVSEKEAKRLFSELFPTRYSKVDQKELCSIGKVLLQNLMAFFEECKTDEANVMLEYVRAKAHNFPNFFLPLYPLGVDLFCLFFSFPFLK